MADRISSNVAVACERTLACLALSAAASFGHAALQSVWM